MILCVGRTKAFQPPHKAVNDPSSEATSLQWWCQTYWFTKWAFLWSFPWSRQLTSFLCD